MKDAIQRMTLEEKVGQLFTFYNTGLVFSDFAKKMIVDYKAGGMFIDMGGLDRPEQVHRLTTAMQQASISEGSGIPLFVSADFVAGAGCKLKSGGAVHFPKNKAVGAAGDEVLAYESGRVTAEESLAMGVNFNYSPVVDINNNPLNPVIGTHSFGEDRDQVAAMGCAVIRGYQEHGMIATAKHFPGHGDTHVDSHLDLPVLPFDRERLDSFELFPFRKAIEAGVDAIMVGHIAVPALDDSGMPASLSYKMTTGLLREELGFEGLVVTDGMSMKGVTNRYSQAEACVLALKAGADILLAHARNVGDAGPIVEAALQAVRSGELSEERIERSVERILRMKAKYGLLPDTFRLREFDSRQVNKPESEAISVRLARKALTSVNGFQPLGRRGEAQSRRWTLVWDKQVEQFAEQALQSGAVAAERKLDTYADVLPLLTSGTLAGPVIVAWTHNKRIGADVMQSLNQYALSHPGDVVLVHFGSAYDLEHAPDVPALLLYDRAPSLQQVAAEKLFV